MQLCIAVAILAEGTCVVIASLSPCLVVMAITHCVWITYSLFTACEITQHNFQRSPKPDIAMLIVLMGTEVIGVCDGENGLGEKDNGGDSISKEGTCEVID